MLKFRPHHFLCTLGFEGKGYSEEFVRGYAELADRLRAPDGSGDTIPILVTAATDSICAPCPNRRGEVCQTEAKIQQLDQGHAGVLGITPGQTLSWGEAKNKIAEKMTDEQFDRVCAPCSWKALGVCKAALHRLRESQAQAKLPTSPSKALLASWVIAAFGALAAPHSSQAALVRENDSTLTQQRPLDAVRADLVKKHKSRPARTLKKAWDAWQAKKFAQAITLAGPVANDAVFGDYGNWIVANSRYGEALVALISKNYSEALRDAEGAVTSYFKIEAKSPYSPLIKNLPRDVGLAEVAQGDAYAAQKKWKQAEGSFEHGFQRLSAGGALGLVRPPSLHGYALTCAALSEKAATKSKDKTKLTSNEMCDAWIVRFSFFYPKNSEEMRTLTQVLAGASERPKSNTTGKLTQTYKAPDMDQTAFEQSIALYLDGKFGNAIKSFQQFTDEYPKSPYRYRVRYWLAQALSQQQQHDKAQLAYETLQHDSPLTYYGLLAAFASGHNMDAPIDASVPAVLERDPLLHAAELLRLERAEQFTAEGAVELAASELKEFRSRDAFSSPFLMYLAALATEAHAYGTAFGILSDLIARGYDGATSAEFLAMVFPLEQLDEIRKQSAVVEVDPVLVLGLIKQESAFDKSAISGSGALGLMQLMPATASDTDPSVDRADLVQPATNIRVGATYLKHLLTRFNGNIVLALAGYNAGPNAADRWFREQGTKRGMLDFIETIPYKETREYVASIVRNYYWYSRKLTPNEPAKALSFFWSPYAPSGAPSSVPGADNVAEPAAETPSPTPTTTESAPAHAPVPLLPIEE